jgi:hypothetical protein
MATTDTQQYRGYEIVLRRQWESWCAEAHPTQDDLPFLGRSALDTLASSKEGALALAKARVDRVLETEGRSS